MNYRPASGILLPVLGQDGPLAATVKGDSSIINRHDKTRLMKNAILILKSVAGTLFLMLIMSAALLLPFGSLKYSLAWLYLAVFFISVSVITFYLFLFDKHLLKSRLTAGPVAETKPIHKLIQSIAGLAFISIFIVSALDYRHK